MPRSEVAHTLPCTLAVPDVIARRACPNMDVLRYREGLGCKMGRLQEVHPGGGSTSLVISYSNRGFGFPRAPQYHHVFKPSWAPSVTLFLPPL